MDRISDIMNSEGLSFPEAVDLLKKEMDEQGIIPFPKKSGLLADTDVDDLVTAPLLKKDVDGFVMSCLQPLRDYHDSLVEESETPDLMRQMTDATEARMDRIGRILGQILMRELEISEEEV